MPDETKVNTEGGSVVKGNVTTDGDFVGRDKITINQPLSGEEIKNRRNLAMLRQSVKQFWIDGVLKHSLYQEALIRLNMVDRSDAVENQRWNMILRTSNEAGRSLAPGIRIIDVFDQMEQHLLIVGEPGSGKTTMLLELARDTIARAEQDPILPGPVIFNLSSWSNPKQSIDGWLVDELITKYSVSRKDARRWIEQDELLLLLDGLDEVKKENREGCVRAINAFRQEHGQTPLVICSRIVDYEALTGRLQLHGAVLLQPLTPQQVEDYFEHAGAGLAAVHQVWQEDALLQELVRQPLLLSIMTMAYGNASTVAITSTQFGSAEAKRKHLFDAFIQKMFGRVARTRNDLYAPNRAMHWLAWLAQKMIDQSQSIFLLERMRRRWLHSRTLRVLHTVVVGLVAGLVFGLALDPVAGLVIGLLIGVLSGLDVNAGRTELLAWSWKAFRLPLIVGLVGGLIVWLVYEPVSGLALGAVVMLVVVLGVGLGKREMLTIIRPNQGIHQSLKNAVLIGLTTGLVSGLVCGLVYGLEVGLYVGLTSGAFVWIVQGGITVISHYILRLLLYVNGHIPLNYVHFLDYAAERIFLRKVGGGYIFIHRLVMEHFAAMSDEDIKRIADSVTKGT